MTNATLTATQEHTLSVLLAKVSEGEPMSLCQRVADESGIGAAFRAVTARPDLSRRQDRRQRQEEAGASFNRSFRQQARTGPSHANAFAARIIDQVRGATPGESK